MAKANDLHPLLYLTTTACLARRYSGVTKAGGMSGLQKYDKTRQHALATENRQGEKMKLTNFQINRQSQKTFAA